MLCHWWDVCLFVSSRLGLFFTPLNQAEKPRAHHDLYVRMLHNIKLPLDIHTTITYMYTSPTVHLCAADRELTISYCRSTLVSWWNTRFAFIESQNCPWAHCSLMLTPESWMTSLGYFYTWRVNSFIDCRTMRHFPMIHDNDLIVALFLETGKWLGYNESTVGRLQRQLDCLVSWWWLISGHQLKVHNSLIPDGWMDGWVCYSWSWLLDHEYLSAFPAPSSWTHFLFIVQSWSSHLHRRHARHGNSIMVMLWSSSASGSPFPATHRAYIPLPMTQTERAKFKSVFPHIRHVR